MKTNFTTIPSTWMIVSVIVCLIFSHQNSFANNWEFDPPMAICQDITINLDVGGIASITPGMVDNGSFDNSTPVTLSVNISDFDCNNVGYNEVTLTVTDQNGDSSDCISEVAVIASEACPVPTIANSGGVTIQSPCTCRGNFEFDEEIVIDALPDQLWIVVSSTLLNSTSGSPYLGGTFLSENPANSGNYTLVGYHLDGQGYSIEIESIFYPGLVLSLSNTCFYPHPEIENLDNIYCLSSNDVELEVSGLDGIQGNGDFTINGTNATTFSPTNLGIGDYVVEYAFEAGNPAGQFEPFDVGCFTAVSMTVEIIETPDPVCQSSAIVGTNPECSALVLPADVLMGNYDCFDDYEVEIFNNAQNIGNVISSDLLDISLLYTVTNLVSGESCTGNVTLNDLTPPEIFCVNQVRSCAKMVTPTTADNCDLNSFAILNGETILDNGICDNDTVIVERMWTASDEFGNISAPCFDTITFFRTAPDNIDFPNDVQFSCAEFNLNAQITTPNFSGFPNPTGGNYCEYEATFSDIMTTGNCNNFEIERTWSITDWCTGNVIISNSSGEDNVQIITVEDNMGPEITLNPIILNVNNVASADLECSSTGFIEAPIVVDDCHDFSIQMITPIGELVYSNEVDGADGGTIPSPGLGVGEHTLTITATDDCGNMTQIQTTITVEDNLAPLPACPLEYLVQLEQDGEVEIPAADFDDGSFDNCCIGNFEVKRLPNSQGNLNCQPETPGIFEPSLIFCCEDIKFGPTDLTLRVFDCSGNFSDCDLTVQVQDLIAPEIVSCPENVIIYCDDYMNDLQAAIEMEDYSVLNQYGQALFIDNCELIVSTNTEVDIDNCFEGEIIRNWIAQDAFGNGPSNCSQTIRIEHVSDWVVEFPEDQFIVCSQTAPDFGEPEIFFETCEMITISFEDEIITGQNNVCYQINRTWSVVNWCVVGTIEDQEAVELPESQLPFPFDDLNGDGESNDRTFRDSYDGTWFPNAQNATSNGSPDTDPDNDPWDGYIEYMQVIEVEDNMPPSFPLGCEAQPVCLDSENCTATLSIPIIPVEDCSGVNNIEVVSDFGMGLGAFLNVVPGDYNISYTASDICGNASVCQTVLTVQDCEAPNAECIPGVSLDFSDEGSTSISLSVNEINDGSFDNCPGDLQISFSETELDTLMIIECDSVGATFSIQLWVTDQSGNQNDCTTSINVTDDFGLCEFSEIELSGTIITETGSGIGQTEVSLSGLTNNNTFVTDGTGDYIFTDINAGDDLSITPTKDINHSNGLTTFDLVLITKHVLNQELLDSPYKIIAADANGNNSVSTFDLVIFRKVILFIDPNFGDVPSWRFIDANHNFSDPTNPFLTDFPEAININDINESHPNLNFIGVKIGDVNGSADPLNLLEVDDRNFENNLKFQTENQYLETGNNYQIPIYLADFQHIGFQFTLEFDNEKLDFEKIESDYLKDENFGLNLTSEGAITASWFDLNSPKISDNEPIFTLYFNSKSSGFLENLISINSKYTKAEAYNLNEETEGISLAFSNTKNAKFQLFSNYPNPFQKETAIQFSIPNDGLVNLKISDISGKIIYENHQNLEKGIQDILIQKNNLNGKGVYFYQLQFEEKQLVGKMILR